MAGACALSSQATIYLVGNVKTTTPATDSEEATEAISQIKKEMDDRGDGICTAWLQLEENQQLLDFKILNDELVTESCDGMLGVNAVDEETTVDPVAIMSTQTLTLANGKSSGDVTLDQSIAGDRDFDVFFDPTTGKLTMVSKWYNLFVRGAVNGWGFGDEFKLNYDGSGIYNYFFNQGTTLMGYNGGEKFGEADPGFKIASGDWGIEYSMLGDETSRILELDTAYPVEKGDNLYLGTTPQLAQLTFDAVAKTVTVKEPTFYLRGANFGGWDVDVVNMFQKSEDAEGVYELEFAVPAQMNGGFKVADANWTGNYNFGAAWGQFPVLKLTGASWSSDIQLAETDGPTVSKLYFAPYYGEGTLKGKLFLGMPEAMYIVGLGDWTPSNPQRALTPKEGELGVYEIKGVEPEGTNTDFRIYDGKNDSWDLCSWGIGEEDTANNLEWAEGRASAEFVKGWKGKVNLPQGGKYDITLNVFSGKMSIVDTNYSSSVAEGVAEGVSVVAANGEIAVKGAAAMDVYTISGALVATGADRVRVAAGLYIVKAAGKAFKVIVK